MNTNSMSWGRELKIAVFIPDFEGDSMGDYAYSEVHSFSLVERLAILSLYLIFLFVVHVIVSSTWIPSSGIEDLWFVSAVAVLSFDLLSSPFFVKPKDALTSCVATLILLWSLDLSQGYHHAINSFRWVSLAVISVLMVASATAVLLHRRPRYEALARVSYNVATCSGGVAIVFTAPALVSILGFHHRALGNMVLLMSTWISIVWIKPLELLYSSWMCASRVSKAARDSDIGEIVRVDSPNLVRVRLQDDSVWNSKEVYVGCLANKSEVYVIPLFTQIQDERLIGTGLCVEKRVDRTVKPKVPGFVYKGDSTPNREDIIEKMVGKRCSIVGFVVEDSSISHVRFEIVPEAKLVEGSVVFCIHNGSKVFYQVVDAKTSEEVFLQNPHGTQIVTATQLGTIEGDGFTKYPWLPRMNTPVFVTHDYTLELEQELKDGFVLGYIPGTKIPVVADFGNLSEFHTAILGVTGTGKTELAFDIIRMGLREGAKVFCVDFTGDYRTRLADLDPVLLGLDQQATAELAELIDAVETGKYHAEDEKRALKKFVAAIQPGVQQKVTEFLEQEGSAIGIFELDDIANTRATLRATELYLSSIFKWAKDNRKRERILVVLEEAHTVVPEVNLFGWDRNETNAVIGRISQIALQGRKYGVGLLLISQRTALVSKTLLSQCNTVITFSLVDKTSLEYLSSVYSPEHVQVIPNLESLRALAYGKGIRSQRPVIMEIPFNRQKKEASERIGNPVVTYSNKSALFEDRVGWGDDHAVSCTAKAGNVP